MSFEYDQNFSNENLIPGSTHEEFITTNFILTESQNELVEKFNTAFVEAQNTEKNTYFPTEIIDCFGNILNGENIENFEENLSQDLPSPNLESENTNFLLDLFFSKSDDFDSNTDITSSQSSSYVDSQNYFDSQNVDYGSQKSVFFVPPPFSTENQEDNSISYENFDDLGLSDLDFCENLSNSSFDIETITTELCEGENYEFEYENSCVESEKPLENMVSKNYGRKTIYELDNFIRNSSADSINIFAQVSI